MALALEAEKNGVTIEESTEVFDIKDACLHGKDKLYIKLMTAVLLNAYGKRMIHLCTFILLFF